MQINKQFFVQDRGKMTENSFRQVLVSSICGILLCMIGLVGTTWAWFTVGLENTENVLQIGTPSVILTIGEKKLTSGDPLAAGEHKIRVAHANDPDVFQNKSTLYVTFSVDGAVKGHLVLNSQNKFMADFSMNVEKEAAFTWIVSWIEPDAPGPELSHGGTLDLSAVEESLPTDHTEASTEASSVSTESTGETQAASDPSTTTTEATGTQTEGTEETSKPAETTTAYTEATESTTAPTVNE